jgi:hypothetical protein
VGSTAEGERGGGSSIEWRFDCKNNVSEECQLYDRVAAGSPGRFTRLLSCADPHYAYLNSVPTHLTPLYDTLDPTDNYAAYNLPGGALQVESS